MELIIMFLIILLIVEVVYCPRIEKVKDNTYAVFYGKKKRKYIILFL